MGPHLQPHTAMVTTSLVTHSNAHTHTHTLIRQSMFGDVTYKAFDGTFHAHIRMHSLLRPS